ncbi:hypothetical protein, partial [Nonomuraea basaltis]|uniref:hypothetical protein n=1 Tax=Nonomuraea basaltis TaxID=2495887 RepID=UPI00110C5D5B
MSVKDVNKLIKQARRAGLICQDLGDRWKITNPETGETRYMPNRAIGRGLANATTTIRQLRTPMQAAVSAAAQEGPQPWERGQWDTINLLALYVHQGGHISASGGLLRLTGPLDLEPLAGLLRTREPEVIDLVNSMPQHFGPAPQPVSYTH